MPTDHGLNCKNVVLRLISVFLGIYSMCALIGIIGASLSEPHTSGTALAEVVCMFAAIYRKF